MAIAAQGGAQASPRGRLQLPEQGPAFGGQAGYRAAIGTIFEAHILISGLVSGLTMLGPITEWVGWMRRRPQYDRLSHGAARFYAA